MRVFDLVEVEDEVQLADVAEVAIQHLHEVVDDLHCIVLVIAHSGRNTAWIAGKLPGLMPQVWRKHVRL